MKNTSCKKCIFSNTANSNNACEFDIINIIKDTKDISVEQEYNYIKNYECQYALDDNFYQENIADHISKEDLKDHIFYNRTINYWLVINCNSIDDIDNACKEINSFHILPKKISFFVYSLETEALEQLTKKIGNQIKDIKWTVHQILDQDELDNILYATISVLKQSENLHYFLITDIDNIASKNINNKSINLLNHICTIEQPEDCNALQQQNAKKDSIDSLFMSMESYKYFTKHYSQSISYCIDNVPNFCMCNYD